MTLQMSYLPCLNPAIPNIILFTLHLEQVDGKFGSYLRLVNRSFNDEILRVWYITLQAQPPGRQSRDTLHSKVLARRYLQGAVAREGSDPAQASAPLTSINQAISQFRTLAPAIEASTTRLVETALGDPICGLVCKAVSDLYRYSILSEVDGKRWPHSASIKNHGFEAWQFIAACSIGNLELMRAFYCCFRTPNRDANDADDFLRACLCVAVREGWDNAFHSLLHLGFNLNGPEGEISLAPLTKAAQHGRVIFLWALLDPELNVHRNGSAYEWAISFAANHSSRVVRAEMIEMLFRCGKNLPWRKVRNEAFFGACRWNDAALAASILDDGDVDMYRSNCFKSGQLSRRSAFTVAAENDSIDCVRIILNAKILDERERSQTKYQFTAAYRYAVANKSLVMLTDLLPYQDDLSHCLQYLSAARVDGGLHVFEAIHGPVDLSMPIEVSAEVPLGDREASQRIGTTLGCEALWQAVNALAPQNVEVLLDRGASLPADLPVVPWKSGDSSAKQQITETLARHGRLWAID